MTAIAEPRAVPVPKPLWLPPRYLVAPGDERRSEPINSMDDLIDYLDRDGRLAV